MSEQPVVKVKAKLIIPKSQNDKESGNKNDYNKRESFNMKNASNPNTKVTKIQEKNINGNYGRIYIQENQKNNPIYSRKYEKPSVDNTKLRGNQNNTRVYTKINDYNQNDKNRKRYANSVDRKNINKYRGQEKSSASHLRRKSFDRGGDYNNIQVTHIIYSSRDDIDFHIIDPLVIITEENKKKYRGSLDKKNRNGKDGSVKVEYRSSCDNIKINPRDKKRIIKSEVVYHRRENPHLQNINNNNNNNNKVNNYKVNNYKVNNYNVNNNKGNSNNYKVNNRYNNKGNSYSTMSKQRYSRPVNRNERK